MILANVALLVLTLAGLALWGNKRFQDEERLPMQWWLTGEVTWSAPRPFAIAFIPALAVLVLVTCAIMMTKVPPRVGQEDMVLPVLFGLGTMFVAVQLLHLWLIEKTLRRDGS